MIHCWEFYMRCNKSCVTAGTNTLAGIQFCNNVLHVLLAVKAPETGIRDLFLLTTMIHNTSETGSHRHD